MEGILNQLHSFLDTLLGLCLKISIHYLIQQVESCLAP